MGKLLWTVLAATMGFVAAVAVTPGDEDSVREAYRRGYAEGTKSLQTDAVRRGYGVWDPSSGAEGTPDAFRWASQVRGRGSRPVSDQTSTHEPERSSHRDRDHGGRRDHDAG